MFCLVWGGSFYVWLGVALAGLGWLGCRILVALCVAIAFPLQPFLKVNYPGSIVCVILFCEQQCCNAIGCAARQARHARELGHQRQEDLDTQHGYTYSGSSNC